MLFDVVQLWSYDQGYLINKNSGLGKFILLSFFLICQRDGISIATSHTHYDILFDYSVLDIVGGNLGLIKTRDDRLNYA